MICKSLSAASIVLTFILSICYCFVYASEPEVQTRTESMNEPSPVKSSLSHPVTDPECTVIAPGEISQAHWSQAKKHELQEAYGLHVAKKLDLAAAKYKSLYVSFESFEIAYNYGVALAASGRLAESAETLQRSISINPRFKPAYKLLSLVQKSLKQDSEAKLNMDRYLQL